MSKCSGHSWTRDGSRCALRARSASSTDVAQPKYSPSAVAAAGSTPSPGATRSARSRRWWISAPCSTRSCSSSPKNGVPNPPSVQRRPILPFAAARAGEIVRSASPCSAQPRRREGRRQLLQPPERTEPALLAPAGRDFVVAGTSRAPGTRSGRRRTTAAPTSAGGEGSSTRASPPTPSMRCASALGRCEPRAPPPARCGYAACGSDRCLHPRVHDDRLARRPHRRLAVLPEPARAATWRS